MLDFNYWAILVALVASQVLGAFWYSQILFGKPWMKLTGLTAEYIKEHPPKMEYVVSLVGSLITTLVMAWLHQRLGSTTVWDGLELGLIGGVGFAGAGVAANYAFTGRSSKLFLIELGQVTIGMIIISLILALWR